MKIIAGVEKSFQGDVHFSDGYNIGYLEQEPKLDDTKTVIDIVKEGAKEQVELLEEYNKINDLFGLPEYYEDADKMEQLMKKQGTLQDQIDACNAWDLETKLNIAMDALRCPPSDESVKYLSGGEKRRVALCRLLLQEPDILLLDEPTAGVDVELRKDMWKIVENLRKTGVTIILTTHYIEEAEAIADRVGVINQGEIIVVDDTKELLKKMGHKKLTVELQENINEIPLSLNKYNLSLSIKRAEVVKEILINYGINQSSIKILGKGEETLAVDTPDDTKQPANRRVEIKKTN